MTNPGGIAAERLRSFVERIERLEEEKKTIQADIREVKSEAKNAGFDVKTINEILRLRKMDQSEREEHEALVDIYKAALGMLYDTPLGEAARRRLSGQPEDGQTDIEDHQPASPPDPAPDVSVDEAAELGRKAAEGGRPVTDNPFPARDKRRAAWDEAWCRATGSDGMDIPEAWRRKKTEKTDNEPEPADQPSGTDEEAA
jgi:uncharacterized protein (UPF0335 family)